MTAILPITPDPTRQAQTRLRLLDAAAREFAENGYQNATVRDICKRAEANVAAVNYHFGDKERLYAATLDHWIGVALEKYPPLMGVPETAPAVERLRGFIQGCMLRMLDGGSAGWHGQLMAREMVEPTAGLDQMIKDTIEPMVELLHGIVRDLAGGELTEAELHRCGMSVIGQCCFYRHAREVVTRMFGPDCYAEPGLTALVDHVTRFTASALSCYAASRAVDSLV